MEQRPEISNLYALLIGINCYLPNRLPNNLYYKSLWGCVQDVLRVGDFLRNRLGVPDERVIKLTSSSSETGEPAEPPTQWPTYENIVNAFRNLGEIAQPGDQVYIHYSGHGGRTPTTAAFHSFKGPDGIDEVLVPMDLGNSEGRYLRDTELQHLLKVLVDKRLMVTLVLDSCHAGGATRGSEPLVDPELGETGVRGIGVIDTTPRPLESLVAPPEQLVQTWQTLSKGATRAVQAGSGWLLEPQGYVLIAACRANEYANEYPFEGNEKNGAVSYWLVDSLKQVGPGFTYKMLHDRLLAKVHGQFVDQTPQLQGEGNRVVFGTEEVPPQHAVTVIKANPDQTVLLNAGQAHGIRPGSQFRVYALNETDLTKIDKRIAVVEITDPGATSSSARILNQLSDKNIEPGCQAVLSDTGAIRLRRRVRLITEEKNAATADHATAMKKVELALAQRPHGFVGIAANRESADYLVTVSEGGEYVICDVGGNAIPNLRPALPITDRGAPTRLVERLVQLVKYSNVRTLDNNDSQSPLARNLLVELIGVQADFVPGDKPEPQPFDAAGHTHTVKDGEWTFLRIQNNYSEVVNITVLDLQPDWGITQIYPARAGAFEPVDPRREIVLPLRVSLPKGYESGTDIIKVLGTLETTSFRWLELPALDQPDTSDSRLRGVPGNPLEEFLSAFSSEESITRKVEIPMCANVEWVVHQVEIETRRADPPHS
jgi:hypothetical protein